MGKVRPRKTSKHVEQREKSAVRRRQHSHLPPNKTQGTAKKGTHAAVGESHKVPFGPLDNVLLVGEGDFSFTLSLIEKYKPAIITATCYDPQGELLRKYPNVRSTIKKLQNSNSEPEGCKADDRDQEEAFEGFSSAPSPSTADIENSDLPMEEDEAGTACNILYGIDATKLSTVHRKVLRPSAPFSRIVFNFPHVGGLSTDINRQVRSNQQLLVNFFNAAKVLLSSRERPVRLPDDFHDEEQFLEKGKILVTLFEGEPYTLWNIRDLVRHCGLQVVESFKFPWSAYPGYRHARTIGDITTGKDRSDEGKRKGSWRGEERDARCYVIEVKEDSNGNTPKSVRKRRREPESSEEE